MTTKQANSYSGSPLQGLRVLELSTRMGYYCGKLLADMGAEVILIEPPTLGAPLRRDPPFIQDKEDAEFSIPYFYLNTNKRSITLDLKQVEGKNLFLELVKSADVLLEDASPGWLAEQGLGYEVLKELNPALVLTSMTPFGQTGPYAHYAADDLTLLAQGGWLNIMGYEDTQPTQAACEQAYAIGCMFGAVGTMLAVLEAQQSGQGQQVDVSIQECVVMALENSAQSYELENKVRARSGNSQRYAGSGIFPCADGYVYIFAGGMAASRFWKNLVDWFQGVGVEGADELASSKWQDLKYMHSEEGKQTFERIFCNFASDKSMAFLYEGAQTRRIPLCPVSDSKAIMANQQLAARGFFTSAMHQASGLAITMPGAPFQLSQTPWSLRNSAPTLGQDNRDIFSALGVTHEAQQALAAKGVI